MLLCLMFAPYVMTNPIYRFHRHYIGIPIGCFMLVFGILQITPKNIQWNNIGLYIYFILCILGVWLIIRTPRERQYLKKRKSPPQV